MLSIAFNTSGLRGRFWIAFLWSKLFGTCVLCSLPNGPAFSDLTAHSGTTRAGFRTSTHCLHMFVLPALCSAGFANIRTNTAKLVGKLRIGRKQTRANGAHRRALVAQNESIPPFWKDH